MILTNKFIAISMTLALLLAGAPFVFANHADQVTFNNLGELPCGTQDVAFSGTAHTNNVGGADMLVYKLDNVAFDSDPIVPDTTQAWSTVGAAVTPGAHNLTVVIMNGQVEVASGNLDFVIGGCTGQIIVEKQTNPDGVDVLFNFNPSWSENNFSLADGQSTSSGQMATGTYSVVELATEGWHQTNVVCSSNQQDNETADNLTLDADEIITCVFTNTMDEVPHEHEDCLDSGHTNVTNVNEGVVVNGFSAKSSTGGNSAKGGNGGTGGNGGSINALIAEYTIDTVVDENEGGDDNTAGKGGNGGKGGDGGMVTSGNAGAVIGVSNGVNLSSSTIDRCCANCGGCGEGGGGSSILGNDTVTNVNGGAIVNGGIVAAKTGKNATDGGTAGNGGTGGSVDGSDDGATAGAGGVGGAGGNGGSTQTGNSGVAASIWNLLNINNTLIKR